MWHYATCCHPARLFCSTVRRNTLGLRSRYSITSSGPRGTGSAHMCCCVSVDMNPMYSHAAYKTKTSTILEAYSSRRSTMRQVTALTYRALDPGSVVQRHSLHEGRKSTVIINYGVLRSCCINVPRDNSPYRGITTSDVTSRIQCKYGK